MNEFLANVLSGINSVIHNYGWSMVVFTILIKMLLLPFDYKSRKSMRRMTALQPQVAKLQKKYANDKEKLNQKTAELYRREKINPMSGCVPMLITMPILFIMFAAMRIIANTELAKQAIDLLTTGVQTNEGWLWVKNIWMPDSPFNAVIADAANLKLIPADIWAKVMSALSPDKVSALAELGITSANITGDMIFAQLQNIPNYAQETALWSVMPSVNLIFTNLNIYANNNGWFILPILAAAIFDDAHAAAADRRPQQSAGGYRQVYEVLLPAVLPLDMLQLQRGFLAVLGGFQRLCLDSGNCDEQNL